MPASRPRSPSTLSWGESECYEVFRELEYPGEVARLKELSERVRRERAVLLQSILPHANTSLDEPTLHHLLHTYEISVQDAAEGHVLVPFSLGENPDDLAQWNYVQAIFFASTILTTIGYGNIAPLTVGGRVFCIMFALVGIPLAVSVLADLGSWIASSLPRLPRPPISSPALKSLATAAVAVLLLFFYLAVGAVIFMMLEHGWTFFDSFYFCFITMTTIGFGDLVPQKPEYMLLCMIYILVGLSLTSTIIEIVRREYEESWRRLQALAEALKRLGEADSQTIQADLNKILKIVSDKNKTDWEARVQNIVTNINTQPKKPKILEIIIYETSV